MNRKKTHTCLYVTTTQLWHLLILLIGWTAAWIIGQRKELPISSERESLFSVSMSVCTCFFLVFYQYIHTICQPFSTFFNPLHRTGSEKSIKGWIEVVSGVQSVVSGQWWCRVWSNGSTCFIHVSDVIDSARTSAAVCACVKVTVGSTTIKEC